MKSSLSLKFSYKRVLNFAAKYAALACILLLSGSLSAKPLGIIGGGQGFNGYAALVSRRGVATKITGELPPEVDFIKSIAMNNKGMGIIGGSAGTLSYAALVSSRGVATRLRGETPQGSAVINSVAINEDGMGLTGGSEEASSYAAVVSSLGVAKKVTGEAPTSEIIRSVAINNAGMGLIGGQGGGSAYAAVVSSGGVAKKVTGEFLAGVGSIKSVAINKDGTGLIGGSEGVSPYAAVVSSLGVAKKVTEGVPASGTIDGVAINNVGAGIIGGYDAGPSGFLAYAALVSQEGVATRVALNTQLQGEIVGVAINNAGMGIIGGNIGAPAYAALVSPTGVVTELTGDVPQGGTGFINSVEINNAGIGLIGGCENVNPGYAALVSPRGRATRLTGYLPLIGDSDVWSVALLDLTVPESWGPGNTYPNALFALATEVTPHHVSTMMDHTIGYNNTSNEKMALLADATDTVRGNISCQDNTKYSFWAAPFGAYAHNKEEQKFPSMTNWIGGAMLGFDYRGIQNTILGVGTAYAFNRVNYSDGKGYARIHQEFLTFYGSWGQKNILIDAALWGGFYQMHNKRNTLKHIYSKAHVNGWLFSPHLGISTPFYALDDWFIIAPFVMFDWANNWQGKIREAGASGLNIRVGRHYTSMLRSEAGLRFYETIRYGWGNLIFEEKASYANKRPFNTGSDSAFFAGSPSNFGIEVFAGKTQNSGVVQLSSQFIPCSHRYPYGSISYQGEFGSMFQSHVLVFEVGKRF